MGLKHEKIGSTYCLLKIFDLDKAVFGDANKFILAIDEDELIHIIDSLPSDEVAIRAKELLQKYEEVYKKLINFAN